MDTDASERNDDGSNMPVEDFSVVTEDRYTIKGTRYTNADGAPSVLLLHMLGSQRGSWKGLATALQKEGYSAVAIDLRGHGESDGDYTTFSEKDFRNMLLDVNAVEPYLNTEKLFIIGASIGANIALMYAAQHENIKGIVLLSPGDEYRGIKILDAAAKYAQPALIAASSFDSYSAESSRGIARIMPAAKLVIYDIPERTEYHGTNMLNAGVGLESEVITWLKGISS